MASEGSSFFEGHTAEGSINYLGTSKEANYAWLEERTNDYAFSCEIFPEQPILQGTRYEIPTGPGLGVEFNESIVSGGVDLWEPSHLHRMDGSYTNN